MFKDQFPIFEKQPDLVYLDTAATALKPACVIEAVVDYYTNFSANTERGLYPIADKATLAVRNARKQVAEFVGASSENLVFTSGATAAINMLVTSILAKDLPASELVVSESEHHSVLLPLMSYGRKYGHKLNLIKLAANATVDLDGIYNAINANTRLVSVSLASNVLGGDLDLSKIIEKAHSLGALVLIDACQAVGHMQVDFKELGADFMVFSGHKLYGPTGIGCLVGQTEALESLEPVSFGGGAVEYIHAAGTEPVKIDLVPVPNRFEVGTLPIAQIIGLAAAVKFLTDIGMQNVIEHEQKLLEYTVSKLKQMDFIEFVGNPDLNRHLISFNLRGVHAHDAAAMLGQQAICLRAGKHCTQLLHDKLGIVASLRLSFGIYNELEDCHKFLNALPEIYKLFNRK